MMHGYRIPANAPGHGANATDSGNGVHSGKHANGTATVRNARAYNNRAASAPTGRTTGNPPPAFDGTATHAQHAQHTPIGAAQMQQMGAASAAAAMAQQYFA